MWSTTESFLVPFVRLLLFKVVLSCTPVADTVSPHCVEYSCKILARAALVFMNRIDLWFLEMPLFPCRFHCIYLCLCVSVCVHIHMHSHTCTRVRTHTNAWTQKETKLLDTACASHPAEGLQVTAVTCCPVIVPLFSTPLFTLSLPPLVISLEDGFCCHCLFCFVCLFLILTLLESPKVSCYPALYVEVWVVLVWYGGNLSLFPLR